MWKDADLSIQEVLCNLTGTAHFPTVCPICKKSRAHIYMHMYNDVTRRGGLWIWCSNCFSYLHGSHYVPAYWKNCREIEPEKLTAVPIYLDEIKEKLDEHANCILKEINP